MTTECSEEGLRAKLQVEGLGRKRVDVDFAALDPDLARRPPRIGSGLSFVGAANDLRSDHPRKPGPHFRVVVLAER